MGRKKIHDHPLYKTWHNMMQRCYIPTNHKYKNYGARGIGVCESWQKSPLRFFQDMGPKPSPEYSLDRIDNDGNYDPENCRWATPTEQARNKQNSRHIEIDGVLYHVAELSEKHGIDMKTIHWRYEQGWPIEKVLSKEKHYNNTESQKKAVAVHAHKKREQEQCKRGHDLSGDNLRINPQGRRVCRTCNRARDKMIYYRQRHGFDRPIEYYLPS